jgi:hypothetical protein
MDLGFQYWSGGIILMMAIYGGFAYYFTKKSNSKKTQ